MDKRTYRTLLCFVMICISYCLVEAKTRIYYIGTKEIDWDYAPSGYNLVNRRPLRDDKDAAVFTEKGRKRIGRVYRKTVYREFTDMSFTQEKKHDPKLGFLGPVMKGEVGDALLVIFKNMASRNYTIHSHGLLYRKHSEGSLYDDGSRATGKEDDIVLPGEIYAYSWFITKEVAPTVKDPDCLTWIYHSHVDPVRDINTGLIGPLLTCKKGSLSTSGRRRGFDKEYALLFSVVDENKSWFLDYNLYTSGIKGDEVNTDDEDFVESNLMHSVNGYVYGNLAIDDICVGDKVAWYLFGVGNEVDIHTVHFHGNPMEVNHHRTDVQNLSPGKGITASMTVVNQRTWMISCQVADHLSAGMMAFYRARNCYRKLPEKKIDGRTTRSYYIAAEEEIWDYGPGGSNRFDGGRLSERASSKNFFENSRQRIGGKYIKARYFEYEDRSFARKKRRGFKERHLGILGPVIRAEVGDSISVIFKNKATVPYSIHPHGVSYDKSNEGAKYFDETYYEAKRDDAVQPGESFTYQWDVPPSYGPTEDDPPCVSYFYSSSVDPVKDVYSGLIGPLVICKRGMLKANGLPVGFDKEFFLYFAVIDENKSWYLERNMDKFCTRPRCNGINKDDEGFVESNKMHQINGFMYGNLKDLYIFQGQKVIWHLIGMGTEIDIHSVHFDGNPVSQNGNHKDTVTALPGSYSTFTMTPNKVGKWPLVCKTNDHYAAGMKVFYYVYPTGYVSPESKFRRTRTYFVGIVERDWDYAPSGKDLVKNQFLDVEGRKSFIFVHNGQRTIGKRYKKALYREFLDDRFKIEKRREAEDKHLGILGPKIIAEEGEKIRVVLKNMASRNYNIYPHGVLHSVDKRGVAPGKTRTFEWVVTKSASPGPNDSPCISWAYYSTVDTIKDTNSGLVGPLITWCVGSVRQEARCRQGISLYFTVFDENESWYLNDNIRRYTNPSLVDTKYADFQESNKMHTINGYIFGNARHFTMRSGDRVVWYLIGLGNEVDMHTVHFHGQTFIRKTNSPHREDVIVLFPGVFSTVEMKAVSPGNWLFHCHVNDHLDAGMKALFTVIKT